MQLTFCKMFSFRHVLPNSEKSLQISNQWALNIEEPARTKVIFMSDRHMDSLTDR